MNRRLDPKDIPLLQEHAENIRNICILAHVDHGKTTLADSLVCANGFISAKLAGKLRFMDSMEEEQQRGITMHTSAISLLYQMDEKFVAQAVNKDAPPPNTNYLVNLVDSPGHIDFSSDVSTATRLCDGALVLIDVLEGICTQTHAVLYKALKERMRPCLVLNKIDRLCLELQLTPMEAYNHLRRIVEGTNALAATLVHAEFGEGYFTAAGDCSEGEKSNAQKIQEEWTFSPERGNVLFASAYDCWGTNVMKFVNIWAKKWAGGINKGALLKYIFDDYCYNPTTKKLVKYNPNEYLGPEDAWKKPLFVVMILEPIFHVYSLCMVDKNPTEAIQYLHEQFGVAIAPRDINPRDIRLTTQNILRKWVPLTEAVFRMVVKCIPSPAEAQGRRIDVLVTPQEDLGAAAAAAANGHAEAALAEIERVTADISRCATVALNTTALTPAVVVFIAKMIPIKVAELRARDKLLMFPECADGSVPEASEVLMGIGRVFSGVLTRSSRLNILSHRHNPLNTTTHHGRMDITEGNNMGTLTSIPVETLGFYICLGPSVFPTESVPAGNIVGIVGLQHNSKNRSDAAPERANLMMSKSATISSTPMMRPLHAMTFQSKPMVRVAVAPKTHNEMARFEFGLQQLYAYDPVVEIEVDPTTGQHTITCLGELHLEQCVKSLSERFAKCEVVVSAPIVPFRETITCLQNDVEKEEEAFAAMSTVEQGAKSKGGKHGGGRAAAPSLLYDPRKHLPPPWSTNAELQHATALPIAEEGEAADDEAAAAAQPAMLNGRYRKNFSVVLAPTSDSAGVSAAQMTLHVTMRCAIVPRETLSAFEEEHRAMSEALQQFRVLAATKTAEGESESKKYAAFLSELPENSRSVLLKLYSVLCPSNVNGSDADVAAANSKITVVLAQLVALGPSGALANAMMFDSQFTFQITGTNSADAGAQFNHLPFVSRQARASPSCKAGLAQSLWTVLFQERLQHPFIVGLHSACGAGPFMQEPVHGVVWVLERVSCSAACFTDAAPVATSRFEEWMFAHEMTAGQPDSVSDNSSDAGNAPARESSPAPVEGTAAGSNGEELPSWAGELVPCALQSGMMISEVREMCRCLLMGHPMRVYEPVYKCEIQCDASVLSALYGVLSKRRSNIVDENIIEGTSLFLITVHLPVVESFGFALELLKRTSGKGTNTAGSGGAGTGATGGGGIQAPQLSYSHWQILPQDPFWKPTTAEELEEFGETTSTQQNATSDAGGLSSGSDLSGANVSVSTIIARRIIDSVRVRKGLPIEVKTVANADKQRTISKNK